MRQEIIWDGVVVGWRIFASGGIFGSLKFVRYEWL
jgi:hypothetical protein